MNDKISKDTTEDSTGIEKTAKDVITGDKGKDIDTADVEEVEKEVENETDVVVAEEVTKETNAAAAEEVTKEIDAASTEEAAKETNAAAVEEVEKPSVKKLFKNDENAQVSLSNSEKYNRTKQWIDDICVSFLEPAEKFEAKSIINKIEKYIKDDNGLDRILYAQISNYIFNLTPEAQGTFGINVDDLMRQALSGDDVTEDCRKIIIKIVDHYNLVKIQIESIQSIFDSNIVSTKANLKTEIKSVERDYVTILGIFAAIILAFVGQITFSSSVLQHINEASIYRLLFVILLLAFITINVIWLLLKFILIINEKDTDFYDIWKINKVIGITAVVFATIWFLDRNLSGISGILWQFIRFIGTRAR